MSNEKCVKIEEIRTLQKTKKKLNSLILVGPTRKSMKNKSILNGGEVIPLNVYEVGTL